MIAPKTAGSLASVASSPIPNASTPSRSTSASVDGFAVCDGHGRLKNNWFTAEARPPDMLVNVVVDSEELPPLVGEIQVHLIEIILGKEKK